MNSEYQKYNPNKNNQIKTPGQLDQNKVNKPGVRRPDQIKKGNLDKGKH